MEAHLENSKTDKPEDKSERHPREVTERSGSRRSLQEKARQDQQESIQLLRHERLPAKSRHSGNHIDQDDLQNGDEWSPSEEPAMSIGRCKTQTGGIERDVNEETRKKWPQQLAACLAAMAAICAGSLEGWTSPALPYLQADHNWHINLTNITVKVITDDEASWIGSLAPLGALFGALPSGYLADKFGRRIILLVLTVPLVLGWVLIILAEKSLALLYTARFTLGLAMGASTVVIPLYNEEIAETRVRGELGTYMEIAISLGILFVYVIGASVSYIWLCIASGIVPLIFGATFFWMPESPMYLLSKGRNLEAEKSLRWLRNVKKEEHSYSVDSEIRVMQELVSTSVNTPGSNDNTMMQKLRVSFSKTSLKSPLSKTIMIVFGLMFFEQLSGVNAVIFYTVNIFEAAGSTLSPYYCTVIVGAVQVIATYVAALLMDRIGRRSLLIFSDAMMALCLLSLSLFFVFKNQGTDMSSWNWLPLVALNLYVIAFSVGFGSIPWFMMVELATNETKGSVSAFGVSVNWILVFVVTKVFPMMMLGLGPSVTYGILCVICVIGVGFVVVCVPETKGKTREEIQKILAG